VASVIIAAGALAVWFSIGFARWISSGVRAQGETELVVAGDNQRNIALVGAGAQGSTALATGSGTQVSIRAMD
jgi:hypothetical protein